MNGRVLLDTNIVIALFAQDAYAVIKNSLHEKGQPIPENDIWIAAIALQHDITLVTRDVHFRQVDYLRTDTW